MKNKTVYQCQSCGTVANKWMGQCLACDDWNTLVESLAPDVVDTRRRFSDMDNVGSAIKNLASIEVAFFAS